MTKLEELKLLSQIANLKIKKGKVLSAFTSQDPGSADNYQYTLKKLKRTGYPEGENQKVGMMRLASQDQDFAKYYLLDSQDENGNGWGVTEPSIEKNIQSFVDTPFVITDPEWFPESEYEDYDHPTPDTNDLKTIFAHQEKFRVGTIVKVASDDDGRWYAMIKRMPKFAHLNLPPFCSPAIYQQDPHEPDGKITKWFGLHLAGLTRDPAYGPRVALFKGTCTGTIGTCSTQFRMAKLEETVIKPIEMIDQSGLDITETDKKDSPFEEETEVKIASCECPLSSMKTRLAVLKLKQRINKL